MNDTQFETASEASDFLYTLLAMLNDPRLAAWCQVTDDNFSTGTMTQLNNAQTNYDNLINEMENAE